MFLGLCGYFRSPQNDPTRERCQCITNHVASLIWARETRDISNYPPQKTNPWELRCQVTYYLLWKISLQKKHEKKTTNFSEKNKNIFQAGKRKTIHCESKWIPNRPSNWSEIWIHLGTEWNQQLSSQNSDVTYQWNVWIIFKLNNSYYRNVTSTPWVHGQGCANTHKRWKQLSELH